MNFRSVLGRCPAVEFRRALFEGLAPDGSLYVPESLPRLADARLAALHEGTLEDLACEMLAPFVGGIPAGDLKSIVRRALDFPIPLVRLDERILLLELFHGPTLAFKDVGARFLAQAMSHFLAAERREVAVLVATSGDTGGAVARGFHGVPGVDVYVLYPSGKVSELQERQMATLGGNVHAIEVEGSFDDCQRLVKLVLSERMRRAGRERTTANSINVGRLLPQIAYYAWGFAQWARLGDAGEPPSVVVPSGNFGNLTAAAYAKRMGIPLGRLVAATNANDVVPRYLRSGRLEPRASVPTLSNAMDVGDPSNLSRLQALYASDLDRMRADLDASSISDDETLEEIRLTYRTHGLVLDPHTAVGVAVARRLPDRGPVIVAATAHPAKFPEVIRRALGVEVPLPPALEALLREPKQSVRIPARYDALRQHLER